MKRLAPLLAILLFSLPQLALAKPFKIEKWVTKNGVNVVFYKAMEVPMVDVSLAFAAGSAYDGKLHGLSALTSNMMNQGSSGEDATKLAETLADTGSQFNAQSSKDMAVYTLRTLTKKEALNQSAEVFAKIINHPDFPNDAFEREKKQQLMAIEQAKDSPDEVANLNFFNTLYQDHPYAHSPLGTKETVNALSKNEVVEFYKHYYVAHNALLIIVGALDRPQAHRLADKLTQELPQGERAQAIPKAALFPQAKTITIPFPSSQTKVRLGQIGIDHHNPNYFPLLVGNYILGGGTLLSRLGLEVREKRGLTYGVTSQFMSMPGSGPFLISLSTKNNSTKDALKITQDTLQTFINEGPTEKELDAAKQYLSGSFPLSLGSNSAIASLLLRMSFYQLPDDFLDTYVNRIKNTTREEIRQAFLHQVHPDSMLLLTVGQS